MTYTLEELNKMMEENGGSLYLSGTGITSLPANLTVGGSLDLSNTGIKNKEYRRLKNGDYVPGRYLYADGILTHILRSRKMGDYIYYQGKIKGMNVVSDGKHFAHCKSFKDGVEDLQFKAAKDRGAEQYKKLTVDSVVTADDAKTMYRIITGACKQGTERFISSLREVKKEYTIAELITMTRGHYGASTFADFFRQ